MKNFKLLTVVFLLLLAVCVFAACGKSEDSDKQGDATNAPEATTAEQTEKDDGEKTPAKDNEESETAKKDDEEKEPEEDGKENLVERELSAKKVAELKKDGMLQSNGLLIYSENGKYGFVTYDGKNDTGAIFADYENLNNECYIVEKNEITIPMAIEDLNCCGIIDSKGEIILPAEYGFIDYISSRFAMVVKATAEKTEDGDNIIFYHKLGDQTVYYEGEWYVFDLKTFKFVDGIKDTKPTYMSGSNGSLTIGDKEYKFNYKGEDISGSTYFSSEEYILDGALYNISGEKIFDLSKLGDYELQNYYAQGDNYIAKEEGEKNYVVVNNKGEIISTKFNDYFDLYGDLIGLDNKIYNLKGEQVIEGSFKLSQYDPTNGGMYRLDNSENNEYVVIKADGTVIYRCSGDDKSNLSLDYYGSIKIYDHEAEKAYCIKDKDFTIDKADSNILPWVYKVRSGDNTRVSLVDAITGETILSKYVSFVDLDFSESSDGKYLVAAKNKDGVYEIYEIG